MENLSDVEFGSNKNAEEAPILIAQRYLNIFRQMHIFNQEKRTQFDDELLALSQNVQEFFKRMPGGRLLVEHIEDVKTQRGISFVKANKDEFSNSMETGDTTGGANASTVGGNVVIDSSFAETLANSLASAFKQIPSASAPASLSGATISADFGNAFDIIAEEIRTSRASLLDVLKETKNITDSVIASQVSISRILEGILSSQNRDSTDITNLNNRIIASQASITKLLEGLYSANTKKNDEISEYLDLDHKLQDFRKDITQTVTNSLQHFSIASQDISKDNSSLQTNLDIERRLSTFKNEIKSEMSNTLKEIRALLENKSVVTDNATFSAKSIEDDVFADEEESLPAKDDPLVKDNFIKADNSYKKKKKKKKKHSQEQNVASIPAIAGASTVSSAYADIDNQSGFTSLDGVIRNSEYKHNDDFSNIHLDEPPLDIQSLDNFDDVASPTGNSDSDILDDLSLPNEAKSLNPTNILSDTSTTLDDITENDNLDFSLPSENLTLDTISGLDSIDDNINEADGLDFALPEGATNLDTADDSIIVDDSSDSTSVDEYADGLDFALPEQGSALKEEDEKEISSENNQFNVTPYKNDNIDLSSNKENLDDFPLSDFLSNDIEPDTMSIEEEPNISLTDEVSGVSDTESLDDFSLNTPLRESNDDTDSNSTDISFQDTDTDLNSFLAESTSNEPVADIESDTQTDDNMLASNTEDFSSFVSEQPIDEVEEHTPSQSRYSAELDRIRAALTSDSVDISSLDEPIQLDEYSDDENLKDDEVQENSSEDDDWEYDYVEDDTPDTSSADGNSEAPTDEQKTDENWEWEYVDENGNVVQNPNPSEENEDQDWEWEYIEDTDDNASSDEETNNPE